MHRIRPTDGNPDPTAEGQRCVIKGPYTELPNASHHRFRPPRPSPGGKSGLLRLGASVDIVEAHNVILAEIRTGLYLDEL